MSNTPNPEIQRPSPVQQGELTGQISPSRNITRRNALRIMGTAALTGFVSSIFGPRESVALAKAPNSAASAAPSVAPDAAPAAGPDAAEFQPYARQHDWVINQIPPGQKERFKQETDEADRFLVGIEEKIAKINNPELSELAASFKDENKRNRLNPDETPALVRELRLRDSSMPDSGDSSPFRYTLLANDQVGGAGGALFVTHIDVSKTRARNEFGPDFINDVLEFYIAMKQHQGIMNDVKEMLAKGGSYQEIMDAKNDLYARNGAAAQQSYRELMPQIIPALANLGLKLHIAERSPVVSQVPAS